MRVIFCVGFCLMFLTSFAKSQPDSLINALNKAIENRDAYLEEKVARIEALTAEASRTKMADRYKLYLEIYNEYKLFIYDSAFRYACKLDDIA
jgi:hypothetical protein